MDKSYGGFQGDLRFLSNFYPSPMKVTVEGVEAVFPTGEHLYQAYKIKALTEPSVASEKVLEVLNLETPGQAKRWGKKLDVDIKYWNSISLEMMWLTIEAKYTQNPDLARMLAGTHGMELIEFNTWGDTLWGVDPGTNEGENRLGKLLMKFRETLP